MEHNGKKQRLKIKGQKEIKTKHANISDRKHNQGHTGDSQLILFEFEG